MLHHKHIPYGKIETTIVSSNMANDDRTAPLLSEDELNNSNADAMDSLIPSLNPEDPLFGLRSTQVAASREIFGVNEILIPETPLWKLFVKQFIGFLVS